MQHRNPVKSVRILEDTVEYYLPQWLRLNYLEINSLFNENKILTPKVIKETDKCVIVERLFCNDWYTAKNNMLDEKVTNFISLIQSSGRIDRIFDEKYIDIRAPGFKYKDKIMSGPYVLNHMDISSVNIFENDCIIDFEDAVMAPREYDYIYRFFDPYTLRDVSTFDYYCVRYNLDIEKSLYIQLYICEMIFHFVETLGYHRPSIPQTRVYYDYVNKRLFDRQ